MPLLACIRNLFSSKECPFWNSKEVLRIAQSRVFEARFEKEGLRKKIENKRYELFRQGGNGRKLAITSVMLHIIDGNVPTAERPVLQNRCIKRLHKDVDYHEWGQAGRDLHYRRELSQLKEDTMEHEVVRLIIDSLNHYGEYSACKSSAMDTTIESKTINKKATSQNSVRFLAAAIEKHGPRNLQAIAREKISSKLSEQTSLSVQKWELELNQQLELLIGAEEENEAEAKLIIAILVELEVMRQNPFEDAWEIVGGAD